MDLRYTITAEERESLYNEVWTDPVTTVAKRYDLSDNGLRKHCKRLGIPLPYPGYWARVKSGQDLDRTPLPKVVGELKHYIREYVIKYKPKFEDFSDDTLKNDEELSLLTEETKAFIQARCSKIQVPSQLRNQHRLIIDHEKESMYRKFPEKRERDNSKTSYSVPINGRYTSLNAMLPIYVSPANIKRAYRIINTIISVLGDMEAYVSVGYGFDSNKDNGYFHVMNISFGFELTEEIGKKHNEHTAKFVLSLFPKSNFNRKNGDKMEYKDQADLPLETQLGKMIYDMFVIANKLRCLDILDERKYKKQQEERKRQERLEQMRKGELAEIRQLEQVASDWDKAEKIRRFTDAMERKIIDVSDEAENKKLNHWLKWARDKADWIDPLTEKEDELLGRSITVFEKIKKDKI
jgi:hypothetical protein